MAVAGQWTLIWHKFFRNKVAVAAGLHHRCSSISSRSSPSSLRPACRTRRAPQFTYAPPQGIALFVTDDDGLPVRQPHVKGYKMEVDQASLRRTFTVDPRQAHSRSASSSKGPPYKLWGLIPMDRHLIGPLNPRDPIYLLGTDRLGRDLLSRLIYGTRVSMSIGLIGVASA